MSDIELLTLAPWLALLAVGLWLMFSPIKAAQDKKGRASERREPVFREVSRSSTVSSASGVPKVPDEGPVAFRSARDGRDHHTPPSVPSDKGNWSVSRPGKTDEVLPMEANRQVDGDAQYPTAPSAALRSDTPKRKDAKSAAIGLRAAQTDNAESEAKKQVTYGASADSRNVETSVSTDDSVSAAARENTRPRSILDPDAVADAIDRQTPLGSLVGQCRLLSSFFLLKHITGDAIPDNAPNETAGEFQSSSYFDNYHHRYSVTVSELLEKEETASTERNIENRRFTHDYVVEFFDEALVIVLSQGTGRPEMLVISPLNPDFGDFFGSLVLSSRMTELFVATRAEPGGELRLYEELNAILEHFQPVNRG
jgi:hypothetical protein